MLPRLTLSLLAVSVCSAVHAASFSGAYFFGDSLTDSGAYVGLVPGNARFTTNPGQVWSEILAARYGQSATANNPNNPNTSNSGTNYAQGGAQVNTLPGYGTSPTSSARSVSQQVGAYLTASPAADKNALYAVWGGPNDIFYQTQFAGALSQAATFAAANNWTAAQAAAQAAQTQANSATNSAGTPLATMRAVADAAFLAAQGGSLAGVTGAATQAAGLAQLNIIQAARDTVAEVARLQAAGARYVILPNLPNIGDTPAGTAAGASGKASLNGLSGLYNTTLANELKRSGLQAIYLDINSLMREISSNAAAYGIANTTNPACGATPSLVCAPANLVTPNAAESYFYADGVHPTTAAHRMIAQYAASVIEAPSQVAQMPTIALRNARAQQEVLEDRLVLLRTGAVDEEGQADFFVNLGAADVDLDSTAGLPSSSGYGRQITLGWDKRLGAADHVGFAVAYSDGNHEFGSEQGEFDLTDTSFTFYGGKVAQGFYLQGYGQFGAQSYDSIQRRIMLGSTSRTETSEAKGTRLGAGVTSGYNWTLGAFQTGPLLGLDYQNLKLKSFHEDGVSSTSMFFEEQKRKSLVGSLGWSFEGAIAGAQGRVWKPFAQVAYKHEFKDDERSVEAGLNAAPTHFTTYVAAPDESAVQYKLGLAADFMGWKGILSYAGVSGSDEGSYQVYNLTVSSSF